MSRAIRSYPKEEQQRVISRRIEDETGGLGYWAAIDAEVRRRVTQAIKDTQKTVKSKKDDTSLSKKNTSGA